MSNRFRVNVYSRLPDDRQILSNLKRRKLRYSKAQSSNIQRLADIEKVIRGRRGTDRSAEVIPWALRYFRAALPFIMASRWRVKAAGGDQIEAVQAWSLHHVGLLVIMKGQDWIETQARICLAKPRRFPRIDLTNNRLKIQDGEREQYGLCSLTSTSRPKQIRDAENRERRRQAEQDRRAQDPNHTPRSESKVAKIRAAGDNPNTVKSRAYRARKAAEKAAADALALVPNPDLETAHPVSCPDFDGAHPVSCPTYAEAGCTLFRAPHLDTTENTLSTSSREARVFRLVDAPESLEEATRIDHEMGPDDDAWWTLQILDAHARVNGLPRLINPALARPDLA